MKFRSSLWIAGMVVSLLPGMLRAQFNSGANNSVRTGVFDPSLSVMKTWIVSGKVVTIDGDPIKGASVLVQPVESGTEPRNFITDLKGEFYTDYNLEVRQFKEFSVVVKASKKGFLKAREVVDFGSSDTFPVIIVTLRSASQDQNLLWQEDLMTQLLPRLQKLGLADGLSDKSEKDYTHGLTELNGGRPERALPFLTKVAKRDTGCVECLTLLALTELDSGDWDSARRDLTVATRKILDDPKAGHAEPLIAFGVLETWRHDLRNAATAYYESLKYAPRDPLALEELGRSQLLLENWASASDYLARALAAGAGPDTHLLRVRALLGVGDSDAANQEMNLFLNGRDIKNMPLPVRMLWGEIKNKKKVETAYIKVTPKNDKHLDYLRGGSPELAEMVPAADPSPLQSILSAVGKNVAAYFENFPNTVSVERVHQEKLGHKGKVSGSLDQKFNYLCLLPQDESGLGFTEYRANLNGDLGQPQGLKEGFMLTSGFASASLIFHPIFQPEATFRYLGQQKVNDRDTYVVAFAQNPAKAHLNGSFKLGENSMPTFSQGLAWVDAATYQIVRLRTDLLRPLPEVELERETTEINYGESHFKGIADGFWLPQDVTVSVDWNGKSLRNRHEYSDFKVFNVGATQKVGSPKNAGLTPKAAGSGDPPL